MRRWERGSVVPLVALVMAATGAVGLGLARLGTAAVARARAVTAADAAALAGAAEGHEAARETTVANGAVLVSYRQVGLDTRVVARVGAAEAVGRARRGRPEAPPGSPTVTPG